MALAAAQRRHHAAACVAMILTFGWLFLGVAAGPTLKRIDAPCSACKAIGRSLQARLDAEKVRNHLDLRSRLDSSGSRQGRVIDYKVSELRAIELLENLCNSMKDYTLVTVASSHGQTVHWEPSAEASHLSRPQQRDEEEARQKQLKSWCGWVLGEFDEDITEALQQGKVEGGAADSVSSWLCGQELLGACPAQPPSDTQGSQAEEEGPLPETSDGTTSAEVQRKYEADAWEAMQAAQAEEEAKEAAGKEGEVGEAADGSGDAAIVSSGHADEL